MILPMAAYAQFGYSYPSASQLLVGSSGAGNGGAATSPDGGSSSAPPLSPGGSAVAGGALSPGAGSHASTPAASCCDTPRPIITDPVSGQTVCSCQYDARLALTSYPRLSSAAVGVYGAPYPSTDQNPYPSIGVDSSAFYSPLVYRSRVNVFGSAVACKPPTGPWALGQKTSDTSRRTATLSRNINT
ncbi:hypothetical protein KGM_207173 [Danaus plexippus plexippus]|uniref:Uncharacterized protein n=1 Tax=Danaus plexippus plexippus TaxID=278856 RepID=A0A212EMN7_DANPL|nr:hypothetical protein KGM_207173 [Danaus plexippus plexippus]